MARRLINIHIWALDALIQVPVVAVKHQSLKKREREIKTGLASQNLQVLHS